MAEILLFGINTTPLFIFSVILICVNLEPNPIKPSLKGYLNVPFVTEILLFNTNTTIIFILIFILKISYIPLKYWFWKTF